MELNPEAVRDAVHNAKLNQIKNARFYCNDAGRFLTQMAAQGEKVNVVMMDPPRSGSTEEFMRAAAKTGAEKIVYISCNPETLARDLRFMKKLGYKAVEGVGVDMFCGTEHCETVVLLTRKRKSKDYKVEIEIPIDVDGSKTYTEEKSTYQNIKKFIKAKYGVNTHTKDIAEVKRDCGVEMRLNYNISKKGESEDSALYSGEARIHHGCTGALPSDLIAAMIL